MSWFEDNDIVNECRVCGAMIVMDDDCPYCNKERRPTPKKPQELIKVDPKRRKKTSRRRDKHGREYDY